MINERLRGNCFESYSEVKQGFEDLFAPLVPLFSKNNPGRLNLGSHGTVYTKATSEVEAFLRPLWGLGPYATQNVTETLETYLQGIIAGTDPTSPSYWGDVQSYDQLIVEMASLSTFILLNKEKTWDCLTKQEQENLHRWLIQVNHCEIPPNNWHFFRVLVNIAMKQCEMTYSQVMIEEDLNRIDRFYLGDGWYCDGVETQIDYYVSFAIHYYSLLYTRFMPEDELRVAKMKERATIFAQTFKYWFTQEGVALPFGRSLAYRFAQVSFFSALVFANVEALPWGEVKGIISRHLHWWMQQAIFTPEGRLSVGYAYEGLIFAEGYNAPGSPYWSFKTFILLAVPKSHPYWQAKAQPIQIAEPQLASPVSKNFYQYNDSQCHLLSFPAGQWINYQSHASSKYSKFVYSTHFGNSVPKSNYWYYEGAYDNCLALAEDDHYFRTKACDQAYEICEDRVVHEWAPWEDVQIKTTIIPLKNAHVRLHEIETKRKLIAYEGGFSIPITPEEAHQVTTNQAQIKSTFGCSEITAITGFTQAGIVRTEPNTNLCHPRTHLPHLKTTLSSGHHRLISVVSGYLPGERVAMPVIMQEQDQMTIEQEGKIIKINTPQ